MSLSAKTVFDRIQSHALASGLFRQVNTHEPKNAPTDGPHCAIYVQAVSPAPGASGLSASSAVIVLIARIYLPMVQEPQDLIDPEITAATDKIMQDLSGDFTLGGNVFAVDLLGMSGTPLSADAGYVTVDTTMFRSMDITIPIIVEDAWSQNA